VTDPIVESQVIELKNSGWRASAEAPMCAPVYHRRNIMGYTGGGSRAWGWFFRGGRAGRSAEACWHGTPRIHGAMPLQRVQLAAQRDAAVSPTTSVVFGGYPEGCPAATIPGLGADIGADLGD
jgi:hypothetical protein